ncbi:MAG: hypothetical protein AB4063_05635 [Crocosphaera sp.]
MKDIKKIILHIGPPKTGSTSIQTLLSNNQHRLASKGLLYPLTGRSDEQKHDVAINSQIRVKIGGRLVSHELLAWSLMGRIENFDEEYYWNKLLLEINESSAHTIILSAEQFAHFSKPNIERVAEFLKTYQVQIVTYKRDLLLHALSAYTQSVKQGRSFGSFRKFIEGNAEGIFSFSQKVSIWENIFGKNNLVIKSFDQFKEKQELELDFLKLISVNSESIISKIKIEEKGKNKSPSPSVVRLLCLVNRIDKLSGNRADFQPFLRKLRQKIQTVSINHNLTLPILEYPLWTKEDQEFLIEKYRENNKPYS